MNGRALPDPTFWQGRRVLLTGHTGFKGSWLTVWLRRLGAEVLGVSLPEPVTQPSLWEQLAMDDVVDVRDDVAAPGRWQSAVRDFSPEMVLHLAAQPLVSVGWQDPAGTFRTNVQGTAGLLALVDVLPDVRATLVITTDKVYDPASSPPHREQAALGGRDPYSASKAAAELVVAAWPLTTPRGTARAGNVIGGGDWARDRLLPDLVRAWQDGRSARLRNPAGVRPWQHVVEPLRGYLLQAEALATGRDVPAAVNFGPSDQQTVSVQDLVEFAAGDWGSLGAGLPSPAWEHEPSEAYLETGELTLDSSLALRALDWAGALDWRGAVHLTLEWHARASRGEPAAQLVDAQLQGYTEQLEGAA